MKTRLPRSNGGLWSTRTGGPRTLRHWSLSHALSPSQGHTSFEGKGYDVLFVRHTLNGLQNSSDSQAVERRGYGHSAAGAQLRISDGTNPRDTSVSTSFSTQYRHSLHFFSDSSSHKEPQTWSPSAKPHGEMLESHVESGFSSGARPARGKDPQTPSGGPGAPQPQAPPHLGSAEAAPGWAAREALIHPGPQEEETLRAGSHSSKIKTPEPAFLKCEKFQD